MTLMPVSNDSIFTDWSTNFGGERWMGEKCLALTGPRSSTGSPITLRMRPRTSLPTGIWIGAWVLITSMPRTRPSVESIAMVRTVCSPRCWATSTVSSRAESFWSTFGFLILSAVYTSGGSPVGNSMSTTGPMTCVMRPSAPLPLPLVGVVSDMFFFDLFSSL